jgi:hypothetical protein
VQSVGRRVGAGHPEQPKALDLREELNLGFVSNPIGRTRGGA